MLWMSHKGCCMQALKGACTETPQPPPRSLLPLDPLPQSRILLLFSAPSYRLQWLWKAARWIYPNLSRLTKRTGAEPFCHICCQRKALALSSRGFHFTRAQQLPRVVRRMEWELSGPILWSLCFPLPMFPPWRIACGQRKEDFWEQT